MKNLFSLFGLAGLLIFFSCSSQPEESKYFRVYGDSIVVDAPEGSYSFVFLDPYAIQTSYHADTLPLPPSHALVSGTKSSFEIEETPEEIRFSTEGLGISVIKKPFQIRYLRDDTVFLEENKGFRANSSGVSVDFRLDDGEHLYGGGERSLGMDRRGHALTLYNTPSYGYETFKEEMYYSIPVVISSKKYMLLWDNPRKGVLDLGSSNKSVLKMEATGGRTSYVVFSGETFTEMVSNYTRQTGLQPMPPRWLLGNFSSRFGYRTQKQTLETIREFKNKNIPVDGIVLDIFWFGPDIQGYMGNLDWDTEAFPDGVGMMKRLKEQGVKTVLITEPFILTSSTKWQEAVDKGVLCTDKNGDPFVFEFFFGETGLIDIFKPEAREWFWEIYKAHTESGVDGWWGDLGEPEAHPEDLYQVNGKAEDVHNIYGHYWVKLVHDGYLKDFPEKRPFSLMRAGFAGSQRYGIVSWSGDVNRTWGGLKPQPEIALQMNMQGIAYHHSDLGGFAGDYKDAELYQRWLQYGVFQPVFRPHAQENVPSEPVFWDQKTVDIARKAVELRYRMLPFNYTLAFLNAYSGKPLMTPVFFHDEASGLFDYDEAYLWGDYILVAPVKEKGQETQEVYFPAGYNWVDPTTGMVYKGGSRAEIQLVEDGIPYFYRSGSGIFMLKEAPATTDNYNSENMEWHFLPDNRESDGILYEDDGETRLVFNEDFKDYEMIEWTATKNGRRIEFNRLTTYAGSPERRSIELKLYGINENPPQVNVNGESVSDYTFNEKLKVLSIPTEMDGDQLVVEY